MNNKAGIDPLNIIKGRIAEALVEELLKTCGNNVYRFGYESLLQNLLQADANFDRRTKNGQQVRSIPDFVVVNGRGKPTFVEVKFRWNPVSIPLQTAAYLKLWKRTATSMFRRPPSDSSNR